MESINVSRQDELLAMCRGGSFVGRFYMIASRAVIAMAEREGTEALVALLNDKRFLAHDGQLNVRGILLQKLIPARLPAREAFKWIGPNEPSERSPTYHIFLDSYLPEAMTVADLPTGLAFFKNWQSWPTGSSTKASLALKIVIMALENLHDPAVSELITREWLKKHKRREVYPFGAEKRVKERFELNASLRYEFSDRLLDSIEDVGTKGWDTAAVVWSTVLISDDLLWVLRQVDQSSGPKQILWAKTFVANFHWQSIKFFEDHHEEIFDLIARVAVFKEAVAPVFEAIALDSEIADMQREHYRDREELSKRRRRLGAEIPWEKVVENRLRKIVYNPGWWSSLVEKLRVAPPGNHIRSEIDDDERLVGWSYLTEAQQATALEGARSFLLAKEPSAGVSPIQCSNYDEAAGAAVELILDDLDSHEDVCTAVGEKWIPSIVWHGFLNRTDDRRRVIDVLHRKWPEAVLDALHKDIECSAQRNEGLVGLLFHGFENCFDDRFYAMILNFLFGADLRAQTVSDIGEWLAEHWPNYFIRLLGEVMVSPVAYPKAIIFSLLAVGIRQVPKETWPYFASVVFSEETGKDLIRAVAEIDLVRRSQAFDGIVEGDLGRLYERVATLYPPTEDPPHKRGPQTKDPRRSIASFRELIAQELANRATLESVNELLRLREVVPSVAPGLLWKTYQTTENLRIKTWSPPSAKSVALLIFSSGKSRLVETSEALLDAVIESLTRLQKRLTGTSNPRILEFWRLEVGVPGLAKRHNRGPLYEEDISWRLAVTGHVN